MIIKMAGNREIIVFAILPALILQKVNIFHVKLTTFKIIFAYAESRSGQCYACKIKQMVENYKIKTLRFCRSNFWIVEFSINMSCLGSICNYFGIL